MCVERCPWPSTVRQAGQGFGTEILDEQPLGGCQPRPISRFRENSHDISHYEGQKLFIRSHPLLLSARDADFPKLRAQPTAGGACAENWRFLSEAWKSSRPSSPPASVRFVCDCWSAVSLLVRWLLVTGEKRSQKQYMDAPTLCSVSSVSREWRRQGNDDQYWRRLCRARCAFTTELRPCLGVCYSIYTAVMFLLWWII